MTISAIPESVRRRVFSSSLSDWLDNEVPIEWLVGLLDTIRRNFELFGWDEVCGLPVEPRDEIPPKRFRIDCPGSAYGIEEEIAEAVGEPLETPLVPVHRNTGGLTGPSDGLVYYNPVGLALMMPTEALSLRSIADARVIRSLAGVVEDVVILGGGFIGLEIAATLATGGRRVTVVEAQQRLLARAVAPVVSAHVAERLAGRTSRDHAACGQDVLSRPV